jgi:hypothetical protein
MRWAFANISTPRFMGETGVLNFFFSGTCFASSARLYYWAMKCFGQAFLPSRFFVLLKLDPNRSPVAV